ncbi:MAG: hypothetical protein EOO65_03890, partial [Methanosarcinales archaeon]
MTRERVVAVATGYNIHVSKCATAPTCSSTITSVVELLDNEPGLTVRSEGALFTNSVLRLEAEKPASNDFYFIQAFANDVRMFAIRGDGRALLHDFETDTLTVQNGVTIVYGGLTLTHSGITVHTVGIDVNDGGLRVSRTSDNLASLRVESITRGSIGYTGNV